MNPVDRKRLKKWYGKKYWRHNKEYNAFWNKFEIMNLLLGGIALIVSCFIYRKFHSIHIISRLINIIKFSFFILLLESIQIYSMASIFTNVMILMISQNIYIIFRDIFNWVTKKENVRMDYKRLSVLIGIVVAIYSLIK